MAKKKRHFITTKPMMVCSVCRVEVPFEKTGLEQLEETLRWDHPEAKYRGEGWTKNVSREWACNDCVSRGKAIRANPLKQNFMGYSGPFFAFWDRKRQCEFCGEAFVFAAGEQQYWYEEAKFHPQSVPVGCADCRKPLREHRTAQRKLNEALEIHDEKDWRSWEKLSQFYVTLRCKKKALEMLRRAKNLCRDSHEVQLLKENIAELVATEIEPLPQRKWEHKNLSDYWL